MLRSPSGWVLAAVPGRRAGRARCGVSSHGAVPGWQCQAGLAREQGLLPGPGARGGTVSGCRLESARAFRLLTSKLCKERDAP